MSLRNWFSGPEMIPLERAEEAMRTHPSLRPYKEVPPEADGIFGTYAALAKAAHSAPVHSSYAEAIMRHASVLLEAALAARTKGEGK